MPLAALEMLERVVTLAEQGQEAAHSAAMTSSNLASYPAAPDSQRQYHLPAWDQKMAYSPASRKEGISHQLMTAH
jgi:hypothetical protein